MSEYIDVITTYFNLAQHLTVDSAAYAEVLHPEVQQTEFPNLFSKTVQHRNFEEIVDNLRAGRELLRDTHYELQRIVSSSTDASVLIEGRWEATFTNDLGPAVRDQRLSAQICSIFELVDGKIYRHRQYICYDQA
jgi:limonene-1,2-epoxide hydrolase